MQEVHVPASLPWQEADVAIQHPVSQWTAWGVRPAYGALPSGDMQASLILPMGRLGPAFLAYPNFKAFLGWNSAMVYSTTVAYYATRLNGAPALGRGAGTVVPLSPQQMMDLQRLLTKNGYEGVGEAAAARSAPPPAPRKKGQNKLGCPPALYPTMKLIHRPAGGTSRPHRSKQNYTRCRPPPPL